MAVRSCKSDIAFIRPIRIGGIGGGSSAAT
jgi:hypothetical protein